MWRADDEGLSERRAVPSLNMALNSALAMASQSPCSAGDWWAWCSPDVVGSVVAHLALDTSGANKVWKLGEKCIDRRTATDDFHAGGLRTGSLGRGRQRRDCVQKAVVLTIHQEAEMREEVGPDEGLCNVGHHESPRELPA
jgi:hypothetical protein